MVAFSSMSESKYLKKEDLDERGNLCTIKAFKKQNVAQEGEDPENKYVMYTHEFEKGLVLNATYFKKLQGSFSVKYYKKQM